MRPALVFMEGENVLLVTAPAKINVHLGVGAVRPDGYHELTTVMHALELADEVELGSC